MAYETKPNTGTLFPAKDRRSDKSPNATGSAIVDGKEYRVSAWTKTSKNGSKFQSLSFTDKSEDDRRNKTSGPIIDTDDDAIPF